MTDSKTDTKPGDVSNYVPVADDGTTYRPTLGTLTAHLGGLSEDGNNKVDYEDTTTFKQQGYIPESNRDGEVADDKFLYQKKLAEEQKILNDVHKVPHLVQPLTDAGKAYDGATKDDKPVEEPVLTIPGTVGSPDSKPAKNETKSSPDTTGQGASKPVS